MRHFCPVLLVCSGLAACSAPSPDAPGDTTAGVGDSETVDTDPVNDEPVDTDAPAGAAFVVQGRVPTAASLRLGVDAGTTVTHVMAVDPQTSRPERSIAEVGADGSFHLELAPGRPYVLVFVDGTAVGVDMVVAIFRSSTLDSLPARGATTLDLGAVTLAGGVATAGVDFTTLRLALGLSVSEAAWLGEFDDLSLRYANPDIDRDGVIDALQGHDYTFDVHVRAQLHQGVDGPLLRVDDLVDAWPASDGADVATPAFNLSSMYVIYDEALDPTDYVSETGTNQNGGDVLVSDAGPTYVSGFSELHLAGLRGWGLDFAWNDAVQQEMSGSTGRGPATLSWWLNESLTALSFSNVITRSHASFTNEGTLLPFVRLDTTAGAITGASWIWKKRVSATSWVDATPGEIAIVVNDSGAYVSFHVLPAWNREIGVPIGTTPTGSVSLAGANLQNLTADEVATLTADQICGMGVSYDDRLGLRVFAGGAEPNEGVSCVGP